MRITFSCASLKLYYSIFSRNFTTVDSTSLSLSIALLLLLLSDTLHNSRRESDRSQRRQTCHPHTHTHTNKQINTRVGPVLYHFLYWSVSISSVRHYFVCCLCPAFSPPSLSLSLSLSPSPSPSLCVSVRIRHGASSTATLDPYRYHARPIPGLCVACVWINGKAGRKQKCPQGTEKMGDFSPAAFTLSGGVMEPFVS